MLNKLRTLPQYLVPQQLLSATLGKLANQKTLHQAAIKWFVQHYKVNLAEAKESNIINYKSFNDFFIRELKPDARPFDDSENILISPVDGCVSQIGDINSDKIIQAKTKSYSAKNLLGGDANDAAPFIDGKFATLYLAPKDYHRVHMPLDGTLKKMIYIPGKLFAVKPLTAQTINNLFAINERVAIFFDTEMGEMALVMVGAMIVGGMATVWQGQLNRTNQIKQWYYPNEQMTKIAYKKGQEIGHFQLGSTVILLMSAGSTFNWHKDLTPSTKIKMGQTISTPTI